MLKLVRIFVVIVVCCSVVQSQTNRRTTTKQPTTRTTLKSTISTTSKSTARTTTPTTPTTHPTTTTPVYRVCGDYNSTASAGRIQPLDYLPWQCFFRILAPPGQQIQFTCPIVNLTTSTVQIIGAIDVDTDGSSLLMSASRPVLNRVYTSERNSMLFTYKFVQGDSIDCNWTTIPTAPSTTTNFKLCRHWRTTAPNGTIQPLVVMTAGESRWCRFTITAPFSDDQRIQMSCSVIRLNSSASSLKLIDGSPQFYNPIITDSPVVNKIYTSNGSSMGVETKLNNADWIKCNWTVTPSESEITQQQYPVFKLCRDNNATVARGTIQPMFNVSNLSNICSFAITAPSDRRIQMSCSVVKLNDFSSFLQFYDIGLTPIFDYEPIVNRVYTSKRNTLKLDHRVVNEADWFDCKWQFV